MVLEVKDLTKKLGGRAVIDSLSFELSEGKIHIILGPRGAGKTVLCDVISGCLPYEEGQVLVNGQALDPRAREVKRQIGYMPEELPFYENMTVFEFMAFVAESKKVSGEKLYKNINSALELTGLDGLSSRLIKKLTLGEKKLLGVAQAMLGNPDVILLDDPTEGMNSNQKEGFRELISKLGAIKTVIITTRSLKEYDGICDDLLIISAGKKIAHDKKEALEEKLSAVHTLSILVRGTEEKILDALKKVENVTDCTLSVNGDGTISVKLEHKSGVDVRDSVFNSLAELGCPILSMKTTSLTLDDIYLKLCGANEENKSVGGDR